MIRFPCRYVASEPTTFGLGVLYGSPVGDYAVSMLQGVANDYHPDGHSGLDLAATTGVPIVPLDRCSVSATGYDDRNGNWITVDYGDGFTSFFCHMNAPSPLSAGDTAESNTVIGYVGETGYADGPHLHWTLNRDGTVVNPLEYVWKPLPQGEFIPEEEEAVQVRALSQSEAIEAVKQTAQAVGPDYGQWYEVTGGYQPKPGRRAYLVEVTE